MFRWFSVSRAVPFCGGRLLRLTTDQSLVFRNGGGSAGSLWDIHVSALNKLAGLCRKCWAVCQVIQSPRVRSKSWTTSFQCLGPPGAQDVCTVTNEDVWKAWQAAAFESSIPSLRSRPLSMGFFDWSGSLVPVTLHLFSTLVCVCVCCGMTVWDWLRELKRRKSELVILGGSSCLASPLRLQGLGAFFLPVSFSITNHCYLLFVSPLQSSSHGGCKSPVCRYVGMHAMRSISFRMESQSAAHLAESVLALKI